MIAISLQLEIRDLYYISFYRTTPQGEVLELLLSIGADVNQLDGEGRTALHIAVRFGFYFYFEEMSRVLDHSPV